MVNRIAGAPHRRVDLRIVLGRARVRSEQAKQLGSGAVVSLESLVDEPVDIMVDGQLVARGEVLELEGSFCVRVTRLIAPSQAPS